MVHEREEASEGGWASAVGGRVGFGRWDRSASGGAYLVPSFECSLRIVSSSSGVHAPFLSDGSRLLHQRSRHCLPVRPGSMDAIRAQCLPPYWPTSSTSCSSSLALHGPAQATAEEGRQARTHGRAVRGLVSRRPRPSTMGAMAPIQATWVVSRVVVQAVRGQGRSGGAHARVHRAQADGLWPADAPDGGRRARATRIEIEVADIGQGSDQKPGADAPLTFSGLATFWKRWAHCIAVRLSKFSAI